jgi:hypothetical protein
LDFLVVSVDFLPNKLGKQAFDHNRGAALLISLVVLVHLVRLFKLGSMNHPRGNHPNDSLVDQNHILYVLETEFFITLDTV